MSSDDPTTYLMEAPTCTAVKLELRRAAVTHDLDVAPQHPRECPVPSAFMAASLAANRPAKWIAGVRRRAQ